METDKKGIIIPDFLIVMKWIHPQGKCMSDIHKQLMISYKHLHDLKHTFISLGWITIQKDKRRHNMYLTKKGEEIVDIANNLLEAMDINVNEVIELKQKQKIKKPKKFDLKKLKEEVDL